MIEPAQLDPLDRRILRALQRDGAISHAALAEHVGASSASCWRRIRALESAGVLGASVRLLDPVAIGRPMSILCHVRMKLHDPASRAAFETFVAGREEVMECFAMSGEWDYHLRVVAADVSDYERFLMRELLAHPAVLTSASHFALSRVKYTTAMPV